MTGDDKCVNCGADQGLHHYQTMQCPVGGVEAPFGREQEYMTMTFQRPIVFRSEPPGPTNGDDAAFAASSNFSGGEYFPGSDGLTKREYLAAMAMQGFLSQSHAPAAPKTDWTSMGFGIGEDVWNSLNRHETSLAKTTADFSVQMADALIEALNKQEAK